MSTTGPVDVDALVADLDSPVPLELRTRLAYPSDRKLFCGWDVRDPSTGYVVASCTHPSPHKGDHHDCHTGVSWPQPVPIPVGPLDPDNPPPCPLDPGDVHPVTYL